MDDVSRPPTWQVLLAFGIIYFVWGSTFLAIRVGVREVPPFLLAGMRFSSGGSNFVCVDADQRHGLTNQPGMDGGFAAGSTDLRP